MELVWFLKYINNEIVWCGVEIELAWRGNRQQLILATARVHGEQSKWSTYVCTHAIHGGESNCSGGAWR